MQPVLHVLRNHADDRVEKHSTIQDRGVMYGSRQPDWDSKSVSKANVHNGLSIQSSSRPFNLTVLHFFGYTGETPQLWMRWRAIRND